jgi:general nucleoside transport system ATP-binding protein
VTAYLEMRGISKTYPGDVVANDAVDLVVEQGEIHALVGENGAGKSTLMKILYGMEQPDSGEIRLNGQPVTISSPQAAIRHGIGMVHQHFQLIPSLTVAENVALGYEIRRGPLLDERAMRQRVAELSETFGLRVDPAARLGDLSVGVQQRVEILKLLYRDARLLILDEPSAVLTPQEVQDLFAVLRRLVDEGRTAIFITHKLYEIVNICRRATVLRRGQVVGVVDVPASSPAEIAHMMVGRDVEGVQLTGDDTRQDEPRMIVRSIDADDDRGLPALRAVDFTVHGGEILGIAGVEGNGQHELLETLIGIRPAQRGAIILGEQIITRLSVRQRRARGLALIPGDRNTQGLSLPMSIWENLMATSYYRPPASTGGFLNLRRVRELARQLMGSFDVRAPSETVEVAALSGGNIQKLVIARELAQQPTVLIAAHPTRGLDVGAVHFVHQQLVALRAAGVGILLVSADLDELLAISDRIAVLFQGCILKTLPRSQATRERLGLYMAGKVEDEATL